MINDTPSQEIIIETLHNEKMAMLGSQPMTLLLWQVVSYPHMKEYDEVTMRCVSSTIDGTCCLHNEDVLDDASSYDEDID